MAISAAAPVPSTVVFDIDGTLLDSATGILAGFRRALAAGGVIAPEPAALRIHLGPPLRDFLVTAGVAPDRIDAAAQAYHDYYLAEGLHQATVYPGVETLLGRLTAAGTTLATASAKRTSTARAIVAAHGLGSYFTVIGGTDETRLSKAQTIGAVLDELAADPATTIMVGDRSHDIEGAHACGVRAVGARWGYAVAEELTAAGADWLADDIADLGRLLGF
jgi:phosphoglycolate phosphatase